MWAVRGTARATICILRFGRMGREWTVLSIMLKNDGIDMIISTNVHGVTMAAKLLREDDKVVYRDSAYLGLEKWGEFKHTPPNIALTAVRVGCPRFPITPLAGSGTSKTANPLYVVRWSIPTELRRIFSVSGKRFTMDCEKISTDYMRSLPVRTCI